MRVRKVERGVDKGNCLSLVTIMYLCRASTAKVTIDWIPDNKIKFYLIVLVIFCTGELFNKDLIDVSV